MLNLKDGTLWQWDIGRKIIVTLKEGSTIDKVQFYNGIGDNAYPATSIEVTDGEILAGIPNSLLCYANNLTVYLMTTDEDGVKTQEQITLVVNKRAKPEDYIFTDDEFHTYKEYDDRIKYLEENVVLPDRLKEATSAEVKALVPEWAREASPDVTLTMSGQAADALKVGNAISKLEKSISSPYNSKGSVDTYDDLPTTDNVVNDTYYVTDEKCKYTWNGSEWYQSSLNESDYAEELSQLRADMETADNQLSSEIDDHSEYTGRKLFLEYGYFSNTDFTGGNEQKTRLKSEIITGKNENVTIDIPEGLLCDILKLKNGESTATYLVSGIVGENTYLFENGYDYRMLFKNVDGSTFSYIPTVWLAYGEKNVDVRFNTSENKCKRIKNKNVKKAISEHYIFEDKSSLSQFTNLVGTNDELTVTENGLSLARTQSTNNILMLSNNDDIKRMVVGSNGAVAVLVACEVSAKKGQSLYISEKGFVYIAEHSTNYKDNFLTNIGEFHPTNLYYVTLYGNKVIVKNECGQSLEYEGLKYPSNIGISFPYDRDCRIKSFAVISDQAKYTLNMLYEMSKNTFESNNFVSYSYASGNPNAIKVNNDVACPYYEFNCDKAYGESDMGSDRYRTEIGFNLHKELVPNGRISFEFYLPSESNKIDTHDDVIIQLHDGGGKYTDYRLAPPIALAVNNGKLVLWLNYNEKEPSSTSDYSSVRYELCDIVYDKWTHIELEYNSAYSKWLFPKTIVKVNGKTLANTNHLNGMKLSTPCYMRIGLYEREWFFTEVNETTRTIRIRNINYEY